jgi:hypothetical protein
MSAPATDPHARVATRDDGSDDNGEPLCALPSDHAGDVWPVVANRDSIREPHHIDTEGA